MGTDLTAGTTAICDNLIAARIIAPDATTARTNGVTHWQGVFISDKVVLHKIAPRRGAVSPRTFWAGINPRWGFPYHSGKK
jgi:hypothetical protein